MRREPRRYILEARERLIAGRADLEAAERYRLLAERNPSLSAEYLERAAIAEQLGRSRLRAGRSRLNRSAANRVAA